MNRLMRFGMFLGPVAILFGCAQKPYSTTNKVYNKQSKEFANRLSAKPEVAVNDTVKAPEYFVGTTNFSMRKANFVIIHHTEQNSCEKTLQTFTLPKTEVSAHYVICRDGLVHHMLNDYMRAHHAGLGKWGSVTDMNSCSIGIELDNNGDEPFSDAQINSLLSLLGKLKKDFNIPSANFIGHSDWSPSRKKDPSMYFPWKKLAARGFGLWYDESPDTVDSTFDHLLALRVIGYDAKDTGAAILAFKRHYMQDNSRIINDQDRRVLSNLMKKY
jgi:N-acetylmuramoyl-L-alanine amidase